MPEVLPTQLATPPAKGLFARIVGIFVSPKETYADIVARPTLLAALVISVGLVTAAATIFGSTKTGKELIVEQTFAAMDAFGSSIPDQVYTQTEDRIMNQRPWGTMIGTGLAIPAMNAILAGLIFAVYTSLMGGDGKYKQVFAVVVYAGFIPALSTLFVYPMFYVKHSMSSPSSFAVFMPFLEEASFLGRLVGFMDFFRLWWVFSLAIGVGVLYKRKTSSVAWTMLAVYMVIGICYAAVRAAFSGA